MRERERARLPADRSQRYANGTLGFNQMRFGWMYGTVDETTAAVKVEAIYEPEQEGEADRFEVKEDTPEDRAAEAVAASLGLYAWMRLQRLRRETPGGLHP